MTRSPASARSPRSPDPPPRDTPTTISDSADNGQQAPARKRHPNRNNGLTNAQTRTPQPRTPTAAPLRLTNPPNQTDPREPTPLFGGSRLREPRLALRMLETNRPSRAEIRCTGRSVAGERRRPAQSTSGMDSMRSSLGQRLTPLSSRPSSPAASARVLAAGGSLPISRVRAIEFRASTDAVVHRHAVSDGRHSPQSAAALRLSLAD